MRFSQEYPRSYGVPSLVYDIRVYMICMSYSVCLAPGDVKHAPWGRCSLPGFPTVNTLWIDPWRLCSLCRYSVCHHMLLGPCYKTATKFKFFIIRSNRLKLNLSSFCRYSVIDVGCLQTGSGLQTIL